MNVVSAGSPQTYEEALSGDDSRSWNEAMDLEMNSLVKNKNLAISRETKR